MAATGTLGAGSPDGSRSVVAALRSADWRFLLPVPPNTPFGRLAMLGGLPGVVARAQLLGLGGQVTDSLPGPGGAQGVVAYADAPYTIDAIAAAVAPGGTLYLEVERSRRGVRMTPGRVEMRLRRVGLTVAGMYAVEPGVSDARAFIPLDAPRAMTWHRTMELGPSTAATFAGVVRHSVARVAGRTGAALDRSYVVVAKRDTGVSPLPWVLGQDTVARLAGWTEPPRAAVMLSYGGDRVILFPFAADDSEPVAVVKVTRADALAQRTENEQARTRALRSLLGGALASSIPEPLGSARLGGSLVACERYVPGRTLMSRARHDALSLAEKIDDLRRAMEWLVRFHRATQVQRTPVAELVTTMIAEPLDAYATHVSVTDDEAVLFNRVSTAASALGPLLVPIVCQHRDFAVWNVLRDGAALRVLDWEGARDGPAAADAIHLATTWLYAVRLAGGEHDEGRCVLDLLVTRAMSDAAATAAREALGWYLDELQIDRRLAPILIAAHRVELAARRAVQRRGQGESAHSPGDPDADVAVVRAIASEVGRALQSEPVPS